MENVATGVALSALRYWAERARGGDSPAVVPPEQRELVRHAAWLVQGEAVAASEQWPEVDVNAPLLPIFSRVQPRRAAGQASQPPPTMPETYVRRASLRMTDTVLFPLTDAAAASQPVGNDPITALAQELDRLAAQPPAPPVYLESLFYALQQHAWCLPSPLEAVSLYDFARTHAAVAAALAGQDRSDGDLFLLGGDLSGVQKFIYTLTAEGATKQLRGRSFYLQLLTEATAHYILARVHLPLTNLVYSGGGRFYLVLPGAAADVVPQLRREMGQQLLRRHGGTLYVALGGARFPTHGDSQAAWNAVNDAINADKQRRFAALDAATLHGALFTPRQPDLPLEVPGSNALVAQDNLSRSLEKLAPRLHKAHYLSIQPNAPRLSNTDFSLEPIEWCRVIHEFGLSISPTDATKFQAPQRVTRLLAMQDRPDAERKQMQTQVGPTSALGMRYTVTVAPSATDEDVQQYRELGLEDDDQKLQAENVKPFNLLVAQSRGIKRLGVLRMDVDDLGDLFGQRLKRASGIAGLAYTAALSAALSHFFEGWIGERCRRINDLEQRQPVYAVDTETPDRGSVYAIYSGGDDLFIVGSWHLLPRLAADIRNDFVRYTTGMAAHEVPDPPVTLSAGITAAQREVPALSGGRRGARGIGKRQES